MATNARHRLDQFAVLALTDARHTTSGQLRPRVLLSEDQVGRCVR